MSSIYYVRCEASRLIKIGLSVNPVARLSALQTSSTSPLTMLATEPGDISVEARRHAMFADARERGEWFRPVPALLGHISGLAPYTRSRRERLTIRGTSLNDSELAALLGCARSYPPQMRLGYKPISLEIALAVYAGCGDRIGPLAEASEEEIATLSRYVLAAPHFEAGRPKSEAA